jgi:hypothetical protein
MAITVPDQTSTALPVKPPMSDARAISMGRFGRWWLA